LRKAASRLFLAGLALFLSASTWAQYPGQITKKTKDTPDLRAIAVLEWTGEAGKPKASRLVPVAVLDGGQLQDGGIYLARPQPLALSGEVEYELDQDGKPIGLYDIENAGQEQGSWVGYGAWKPMPVPRAKRPALDMAKVDEDYQSDEPVLHRKHHADDPPASGKTTTPDADSSAPAAPDDPDRPVLHKAPTAGGSSSSDEPTLHRKDSSTDSGTASGDASSASSGDPDRPVLKKEKKKAEDEPRVDSVADEDADPDRPRLKRGKSNADSLQVTPSLMGLPADLEQTVAVSDAKTRPPHPWDFQWANPEDEEKMKSALEEMARNALGLTPPPAPPAPAKKANARKAAKPVTPAPPPEPVPLEGEKFRVFELAYGAGATLVLSAHTAGPATEQKFVTLIAQPDLYGNVLVLLKNVTDGAHLDITPRMRLVDAVDALADNRGELLFELRGATQRQFALYRVMRGQAEKIFSTGGADLGIQASE